MHGVAYLLNTTDTAIAVLVVEIDPKSRLEEARVERRFSKDPLLSLLPLSPNLLPFTPTQKLTLERIQELNINPNNFL